MCEDLHQWQSSMRTVLQQLWGTKVQTVRRCAHRRYWELYIIRNAPNLADEVSGSLCHVARKLEIHLLSNTVYVYVL